MLGPRHSVVSQARSQPLSRHQQRLWLPPQARSRAPSCSTRSTRRWGSSDATAQGQEEKRRARLDACRGVDMSTVLRVQIGNPLPPMEVLPLYGMPELELDMQLDGSWTAPGKQLPDGDSFWTAPTPFVI